MFSLGIAHSSRKFGDVPINVAPLSQKTKLKLKTILGTPMNYLIEEVNKHPIIRNKISIPDL
jgi:hypothetical protein